MTMTDPIGDLLTRIRNANKERHERVYIPASRIKANIVRVLKEEGFIKNFRLVRDEAGHPSIKVYMKYAGNGEPVIHGLRRVSTPGRRSYAGYQEMPAPLSGAGVAIVSTSRGVMTGKRARTDKVGGELLCEVW